MSFFPVFVDHTIVENRFLVISIVPRLLNVRSRAGVYEFGGGGGRHSFGASGIFAMPDAEAALSLRASDRICLPSRTLHTRTSPSTPPTASSFPSSERIIGPLTVVPRLTLPIAESFRTSARLSVDQMLVCPS